MGNKAKRKRLVALLKERGLPRRLYFGPKRRAWMYLSARTMSDLMHYLSFKPGDLVNDCDCFNHVIKAYIGPHYGACDWGGAVQFDQYEFEDGRWSCGCPSGCEPAKSREEIETKMRDYLEYQEGQKEAGWFDDKAAEDLAALRAGEHLCDEHGQRIPRASR